LFVRGTLFIQCCPANCGSTLDLTLLRELTVLDPLAGFKVRGRKRGRRRVGGEGKRRRG